MGHSTTPRFFTLVTRGGLAALTRAANGEPLRLTHMAVGDGGGYEVTPTPDQESLVSEVYRAPLNQVYTDPADNTRIIAEMIIPASAGGFRVRETGLYDANGELFAVSKPPLSEIPAPEEGATRDMVVRISLVISGMSNVILTTDPSTVTATKDYVINAVKPFLRIDENLGEIARAGEDAQAAARGHLGLGRLATKDSLGPADVNALAKDQNLADIPDKAKARTALGLGNSATRNLGTAPGTVAMGDDARIIATKKAIDDTQTGLSSQSIMYISSADDLSNLPSGARRYAINRFGRNVLPTEFEYFIEVLAKRDVVNGTAILATDPLGNTWSGVRWNANDDSAFTWKLLTQTVGSLGLTDTVNRAKNAVQKTGDTMTGNLFLKNDNRMHFAIVDANGNTRMWLFKDKGGDGVHINNGYDGGGEFVFNKNGEFYSPSRLHAGAATFGNNGDVYGSAWGNKWLSSWLSNQFTTRDNNIN
ncbi:phage tail protein, partial [Salmonella enterica]|nr:phage tail protein [Salmonella enterica]